MSIDELNQYVTVILDNRELLFLKEEGFGVPFINADNRTYIPLRAVFAAFGYEIEWHSSRTAIINAIDKTDAAETVPTVLE
ncbi:MAG: stalk domain-containing protein [Sedimentibacter sp.]